MQRKPTNRVLSVLMVAAVFFFILTFSIALPIYVRPFYYAHIQPMELETRSGFTGEQIREAYDEVLDYLTLSGRKFGTGDLAWSESGKAHFADCKGLFDLNAGILMASSGCILILLLLRWLGKTGPYRLAGRGSAFWGAVLAVTIPVCVGVLAAVDFNRAFVVFHSVFFPGKTNWIFDWYADQIIRVLPQEFFRNCAILIGGSILVISLTLILQEWLAGKRKR